MGEEVTESVKKPRIDKEEKGKPEEVVEKNSAVDINQRWLVEKLTPETVAALVMVTMVSILLFFIFFL